MQITYDKMLEMCKEAYPSLIWGGEKDGDVCYSSVSLIDEHLTFHLKDTTALDDCIDKIWNEKNSSAYLWSRKTVQDYIEQVMRYLRARESYTDICDTNLKDKWVQLTSAQEKPYNVVYPIFGIYPVKEVVRINPFRIYNINLHKKALIEDTNIPEYKFGRISSDFQESENYLLLPICANEPERAMELARSWFELFENIAKFCLYNSQDYDIGIFNYKKRESENGYVLSSEGQYSSFSSTGVINKVSIMELKQNTMPIWNLLDKYFNKQCTEIEQRLVKGIRWVGIANNSYYAAVKYIQYIFALESILSYQPKDEMITPSIAHRLSESCAQIIGENANTKVISKQELKKNMFSRVKKLYSNRSKIVHGSDDRLSYKDVNLVCETVYLLIQSLLSSRELLMMTSMTQLNDWLNKKRFS